MRGRERKEEMEAADDRGKKIRMNYTQDQANDSLTLFGRNEL